MKQRYSNRNLTQHVNSRTKAPLVLVKALSGWDGGPVFFVGHLCKSNQLERNEKGGTHISFFSGSSGVSTIVSEFRNKSSISDYSIAGLVTGALFKFNLGIKGMISGGFFGTLIGTVGGIAFISLIKLSGKTMKEIREAQGRYIYARDEAMHATAKVSNLFPSPFRVNFF